MTTRRSFLKLITGAVIAKSLLINAAVSDFTTEIQDDSQVFKGEFFLTEMWEGVLSEYDSIELSGHIWEPKT